jgi:hypothetical protein
MHPSCHVPHSGKYGLKMTGKETSVAETSVAVSFFWKFSGTPVAIEEFETCWAQRFQRGNRHLTAFVGMGDEPSVASFLGVVAWFAEPEDVCDMEDWMRRVVGEGLLGTPMRYGESVKEFLAGWLGNPVFVCGSRGDLTPEFVLQLSEDRAV